MIVFIHLQNIDNLTSTIVKLILSYTYGISKTALHLTLFKSDQPLYIVKKSKKELLYNFYSKALISI